MAFVPTADALTADEIELYLRMPLRQRVRRPTGAGSIEFGPIKPATVRQDFRVVRCMLNVAVRKKLLPANLLARCISGPREGHVSALI